ncbi:restriction endonuclease subunit S [Parabacteroides sp. OF04-13BH]|uniref:restriction endonuclease subunit S n=1 Tax=Parabacteroides sp. OF04-13BH TaxID=2293124 RepID=UPI000EFCC578|nr:restriction endonuclease subunit S [Parabacteroides sp. OF04-13BH]RGX68924.1 restriction endonuclease subunit S [Parabacteroides distasonis]RKU77017.1 restriction endonuclease subunit S [Parabacteroides sp. OF04-13BH]
MADNNENKVLNVPHLRFPEFSEEWEICKVSELLDFYSTNSLSWEQLEYGTKAIMNLHYGLIHVGLPTMVDLTRDNLPNIKEDNMPKNFELCKEGDVAFADASEDTNEVAKPIEFFDLAGKNIVCGLHTIHGRDNKNKTVIGFKGYAFSSSAFHNQIRRIAQGTKIYSISTKNFSECFIGIPSKVEQTKIATLLRLIDERIATQNKIIEDLKKLKSAISERLFKSVKGSTVLLSDLCDIVKGKQINGENLSDSGNYYVMNGGTEPSGYYDNYNVEASTISISEGGNSCGYVQFNTSPFWSGGHCYSIQNIADKVDNMYLYHYLKSNEDAIMKLRIGSGLPNIQKKDLAMFKIIVPKIEWQIKISTFLSSLERKAEIEERIQNVMQKQKLYLLQQMFI